MSEAAVPAAVGVPALEIVRARIEPVIERFLDQRRIELAGMDPSATVLVDELRRLIAAGGKRIRPALCFWAHRAAGGSDGEAIDNVCAALELLHTFALIHDDVMDRTDRRRGVAATHVRFADESPEGADPDVYGTGVAIVVGDLAAVYAEHLLRTSGAPSGPLSIAFGRFDRMRAEMAAGQLMDLVGGSFGASPRVAALKTGSYTAEGPVLIGAAIAVARAAVEEPLGVYARLVGEAFQLRDDLLDGDAPPEATGRLDRKRVV